MPKTKILPNLFLVWKDFYCLQITIQQFVYSWKLEKTDKTLQGKRDDISLWEKERLILKDIDDAIVPRGGEITVLELVKKYLLQKTGVRHNTEANYNFVVNIIEKEEFGRKNRQNEAVGCKMPAYQIAAGWERLQFYPFCKGRCKTCFPDGG